MRLGFRGVLALAGLMTLFPVFLVARTLDGGLRLLADRAVSGAGPFVVQFWAITALWTLGLRVRTHGRPMAGKGAYLANHSSWIDIVVLQRTAAAYLVSKSEVRDWPGIGLIGRCIGTLFIDRRAAASRKHGDELLARMLRGDRMALFPEGTSTDGRQVIAFKSSLFAVFFQSEADELMAQPVSIRYLAPEGLPPQFYGWWGNMDFADHLIAVLARSTGGTVEVDFLPPLSAAACSGRKAMARTAETMVRDQFQARSGAAKGPG